MCNYDLYKMVPLPNSNILLKLKNDIDDTPYIYILKMTCMTQKVSHIMIQIKFMVLILVDNLILKSILNESNINVDQNIFPVLLLLA